MIEALYCHVPFCGHICPFCAFAVHGDVARLHGPYLAALEREAALAGAELAGAAPAAAAPPLQAVYIGGGTPSTLPLAEVEGLLATLSRHFPFAAEAEVAFELNPEHTTQDYVAGLTALGINRLSLGLQSLDDATLAALGRRHSAREGRAALDAIAAHGPGNWNADLLFGAPERPAAAFAADVAALLAWAPPHVSLYGLDIEPGTRFARTPRIVAWAETHVDAQARQYLEGAARLAAAGYRHYEVSNFCRPGREGRQNLLVWDGAGYLGLGPGAHSHLGPDAGPERRHNARHLRAWLRELEAGRLPVVHRERLTPAQRADEALMLALRRDTGLHIADWQARHGGAWGPRRQALAERLVEQGQARVADGRLVLTVQGFLLADEITAALAAA